MKFKQFFAILFVVAYYSSGWSADDASIWTPERIVNVKQISEVQLSPDHQFAAYVVHEPSPDPREDTFLSRIYISSIQNPERRRLLYSSITSTSQPQWSPDGQWISFFCDQSGVNNLVLISAQGGEANPLTHVAVSIQTYRWSPDSKRIVFLMPEKIANSTTDLSYVYNHEEEFINRLWMIDI